ncbi:hypothetical protein Tco_1374161 [Tanacetum coccineum]
MREVSRSSLSVGIFLQGGNLPHRCIDLRLTETTFWAYSANDNDRGDDSPRMEWVGKSTKGDKSPDLPPMEWVGESPCGVAPDLPPME